MNAERLQVLQDLLYARKRELLGDIKKSMGDSIDEDVRLTFELVKDNPDRSVNDLLKHVNARVIGNKTEELDLIESALHRLRDGSYGVCEECGDMIPYARLQARPAALYCVSCQVQDETEKERSAGENVRPNPPGLENYLDDEE